MKNLIFFFSLVIFVSCNTDAKLPVLSVNDIESINVCISNVTPEIFLNHKGTLVIKNKISGMQSAELIDVGHILISADQFVFSLKYHEYLEYVVYKGDSLISYHFDLNKENKPIAVSGLVTNKKTSFCNEFNWDETDENLLALLESANQFKF